MAKKSRDVSATLKNSVHEPSKHKLHYEAVKRLNDAPMRDRRAVARRSRRLEWPNWNPPSSDTDRRRMTFEEKAIENFTGINPRDPAPTQYGFRLYYHRNGVPRLYTQVSYQYTDPRSSDVCKRRDVRRRVLFAMQKTGRRGKSNKTAKWTNQSFIRC